MSDHKILEKAIRKAIDGGWTKGKEYLDFMDDGLFGRGKNDHTEVIFNHSFAKALWGESTQQAYGPDFDGWEYHLQQMVIAPDPIKYLGDHLNG
jgi:hypothetical protein